MTSYTVFWPVAIILLTSVQVRHCFDNNGIATGYNEYILQTILESVLVGFGMGGDKYTTLIDEIEKKSYNEYDGEILQKILSAILEYLIGQNTDYRSDQVQKKSGALGGRNLVEALLDSILGTLGRKNNKRSAKLT